jgi:hypothetical protein
LIRKATCCCRKCSIEVEGEPAINAICHCDNCKRRTGSAFGWSAYFAESQVLRKEGDLNIYAIKGANPQQRWFCGNCGSTLFWKVGSVPGHTGIAGGCFSELPLGELSVTASNGGRCAWLGLPEAWRTSL